MQLYNFFRKAFEKAIITLVKAYQFLISPMIGNVCKFHPSCSSYCIEAISKHGLYGIFLSLKRLLKCSPLSKGGEDHVP